MAVKQEVILQDVKTMFLLASVCITYSMPHNMSVLTVIRKHLIMPS